MADTLWGRDPLGGGPRQLGQLVPNYDVNGAPVNATVADGDYGAVIVAGDVWSLDPDAVLAASGLVISRTAGAALGGHRAVYVLLSDGKAYYANPDATARFTIGITTGAASSGAPVSIQCDGVMVEPSWSWSGSEVVWLGANGTLTQTVPTSGTAFQIGVPTGPTSLRLEPELIAKLS